MNKPIRILIVEDSEDDTVLLLHTLRRGGYEPAYVRVETAEDMIRALESQKWDLVTSDYVMPQFNGLTALKTLRNHDPDLPFIIISGRIGEDTAVEAMKHGANDYLFKGNISRLIPAIERELQEAETRRGKKRAEEELLKSELRYRSLVGAVTDYIYQVIVRNGQIVATAHSPGCLKVTGYAPEEYTENPFLWYEMTFGDDRNEIEEVSRKLHSGEEIAPLEHRIIRKDGALRWVKNTIVPKYDPAGNLLGYDGLISDITERKRYEEELLLQSAALNAAANAIVITDTDGVALWVNPAFTALTGYEPSEITGHTMKLLKSGVHDREFYANLWRTISLGAVWHSEITNRRKDGSLYVEEQTITPVPDAEGKIRHYIAIKQEITQRKQAEKALLENAQMLMELEVGNRIQRSLLPETAPDVPGVQVDGHLEAASHVGGDYYDYFQRGRDGIDLVIADVTGHSIGAALIMAEARGLLHSLYTTDMSAAEIVSRLARLLFDDLGRAELFITLYYARYDAARRTLSYCNAGHNPALLFASANRTFTELDAEGLVLGVKIDFPYEERQVSVQPGDLVVLYTDGITEACNRKGELFGTSRLKEVIALHAGSQPSEIITAVFATLATFTSSETCQDDVSIVVLKIC